MELSSIKDYNRAIQIEPDYADAYGSVYAQKGDLDSAIKDFTDAIYFKTDPNPRNLRYPR